MSPLALSLRLLQTQPDSRLLALAQAGHEPAFEALVRRYRRQLLAYSRRISAGVTAEDVLQQSFLQAWNALRAGTEINDARAWLYRIVHNATISAVRSAGDAPMGLVERPTVHSVDQICEQRLAAREALAQLAALPDLQREVMLGTALEGRSHEEMAKELGLSGGSVRGLLYRARATLRTAAAALIPSPAVDWAIRAGEVVRAAPGYEAMVGGGSVGVAAALIKSGAAATLAGALAGAAAIVSTHPAPHVRQHAQAPLVDTGHVPTGASAHRDRTILLASVVAPVRLQASAPPVRHRAVLISATVDRRAPRAEERSSPTDGPSEPAPSSRSEGSDRSVREAPQRHPGSDGDQSSGDGSDGASAASASPSSTAPVAAPPSPPTYGSGAPSPALATGASSFQSSEGSQPSVPGSAQPAQTSDSSDGG